MERDYFPCPVEGGEYDCPYFNSNTGCFEDTHELYFPASDYSSTLEKTFRMMNENRADICRRLHDLEHKQPPPEKPSHAEMFEVVDMAVQEGRLILSANKYKKIYGRRSRGTES